MAPVLVGKRLAFLAAPLDLGASIDGVRIFGDHKTWRGLILGVAAGAAVFVVQAAAYRAGYAHGLAITDYSELPSLFGAWLGFGAIVGDAIKSFFKRRVGIAPGKPWIGPDEVDFYLGAWAAAACFVSLPAGAVLLSLPIVFVGHLLTNVVAWSLGLKPSWL